MLGAANSHIVSDDVWLGTVLLGTHIVKIHFDMKIHIYAFIMLILNDPNKISSF